MKTILRPSKISPDAGDFFAKLYQARDIINLRHLNPSNPGQLGSGWEHKVLDKFYNSVLDLTDTLVESCQGKYGIVSFEIPSSRAEDPITYLTTLATTLENQQVFVDSWIKNQIDEIITLIYQTLYKLKNLK